MREFLINANDGGQRLDKFIQKLMPGLPKSLMYKGFRKNCVRLNGKHIKDGSNFINEGDCVSLYFNDKFFKNETDFEYVKPSLDIVYEDKNILIIDKKVGVLSHTDEKGSRYTLINIVKSYLYDCGEYNPQEEQTFKPALCNRLDRNTGGLVIAAKNASALREMNEGIRNRYVRKFYTAIVEGYTPKKGHIEGKLSRVDKLTTVTDNGKTASLDYSVKEQKDGYSLLLIELHTGRTHQIRSQFAQLGFPLAGDTKYGGHGEKYRQALYSTKIIFEFPKESKLYYLNNKEISVVAPFEESF